MSDLRQKYFVLFEDLIFFVQLFKTLFVHFEDDIIPTSLESDEIINFVLKLFCPILTNTPRTLGCPPSNFAAEKRAKSPWEPVETEMTTQQQNKTLRPEEEEGLASLARPKSRNLAR